MRKILNRLIALRRVACLLFLMLQCFPVLHAQQDSTNPYKLPLVADTGAYRQEITLNPSMRLVDLEAYIPGIIPDVRYATVKNFTGKQVYTSAALYARLPVAVALRQVQDELKRQGLGLKVFDAYRPYAATLLFYEIIRDTAFVAAPWKGSRHNRGCAVDVTLVDAFSGREIDMPTPFDEFSPRAASNYDELPKKVLLNRGLLQRVMQKYGFSVYPDEWWHFDFSGWEKYSLLDLSFEQLRQVR
ncbi:MAG TPA: M15 family metallopeptidase [Bacteroidales bacterium]|nr:M15 family metallopeptidase [Bacteroidales bacterium]HSA44568.1 M15 family metallopeptidase [Bacteroidales bacterium]